MKRSELYAKVWETPMTQLAAKLGISDVGLAKACRRHAVPAPPRGYWAKLRAGQAPPKIPLPTPELDVVVHFATSEPEERERHKALEQKRAEALKATISKAGAVGPLAFAQDLSDAHPLVKATQRYCERLPRLVEQFKRRGWSQTKAEDRPAEESQGRYVLLHRGVLNITASLESMDWVLRFHATIFEGLQAGGMRIARREAPTGRAISRSEMPAIEAKLKGEVFKIEFSQGYRRVYLDPDEVARRRKEQSWASDYENQPSEKLSFRVIGTEYGASKEWKGTQDKLQDQVNEIIQTVLQLVPLQMELRTEREAAAVVAQRESEARERERRRSQAKVDQLKQAFQMAEADEKVLRLKAFLDRLEESLSTFQPPYDERAKVWIQVVREELAARNPMEEILQGCLTGPSWGTWPPEWWPQESGAA